MGLLGGLHHAAAFTKAFFDGLRGQHRSPSKKRKAHEREQGEEEDAEPAGPQQEQGDFIEMSSLPHRASKRRRLSEEEQKASSCSSNALLKLSSNQQQPQSLPIPPAPDTRNLKRAPSAPPKCPAPSEVEWKSMLSGARAKLRRTASQPHQNADVNKTRPSGTSVLPGLSPGPTMDAFFAELKSVKLRHVTDSPIRAEERIGSSSSTSSALGRRRTVSETRATVPLPRRRQNLRASMPGSLHRSPLPASSPAASNKLGPAEETSAAPLNATSHGSTLSSQSSTLPGETTSTTWPQDNPASEATTLEKPSPAAPKNAVQSLASSPAPAAKSPKSERYDQPQQKNVGVRRPRSSDLLPSERASLGTPPKPRNTRRVVSGGSTSSSISSKAGNNKGSRTLSRKLEPIRAPVAPPSTGKENAAAAAAVEPSSPLTESP